MFSQSCRRALRRTRGGVYDVRAKDPSIAFQCTYRLGYRSVAEFHICYRIEPAGLTNHRGLRVLWSATHPTLLSMSVCRVFVFNRTNNEDYTPSRAHKNTKPSLWYIFKKVSIKLPAPTSAVICPKSLAAARIPDTSYTCRFCNMSRLDRPVQGRSHTKR